jgi:hypothetical protein
MDHLVQAYPPVPAGNSAQFLFEPVKALTAYTQFATSTDGIAQEVQFGGAAYPALVPVYL